MTRLRVLVADDSLTVRRRICDALLEDPSFDVVGEAADGAAAVELCARLRPDVLTLDMMMPVTTGLEATQRIMRECATPILIVSASTNRGELFRTYDALAAGAVDVLEKPRGDEPLGAWEDALRRAVRIVSRVRVITRFAARGSAATGASPPRAGAPDAARDIVVLGIGASTGGPGAIVEVLQGLPAPCPVPIVAVLHMAAAFGGALAQWLDAQSAHRVALAEDGAALTAGHVALAPPDHHLIVRRGELVLTQDAERHSCRPSVDILFESLARELGAGAAACLLTGMGRDGAAGLLAIRRAGGVTIAQDEASSVVFGMPREAIACGAAERVLPLARIGPALGELCLAPRRRRQP